MTYGPFSFLTPSLDEQKLGAWQNASVIPGYDASVWRRDCDGTPIKWDEYGKLTKHGWEIDHRTASVLGGSDGLFNLRARHWQNNRSAGGHLGNPLANLPSVYR